MIGMTSVTFRKLAVDEIVSLTKQSGLDGIEWGGDIHVFPNDIELAKKISDKTTTMGLKVLSYGSYYKLCNNENISESFSKILETAVTISAPIIRIWAGTISSKDADADYRKRAVTELKVVCNLAIKKGVKIGLEYHPGTLTDNKESTLSLLKEADCENLYTYWQPNPDITQEERLAEIKLLKEYICCVHVFYWKSGNERYSLSCGTNEWQDYIEELSETNCNYIMEFVKEDSKQQLMEDAACLKRLMVKGV